MNVIFGSGLVGLLAKAIFPTWKVIPFYKSRFFSFNPALDDNFIVSDDRIDSFVKDLLGKKPNKYPYFKSFSISGHLINDYNKDICEDWLSKIFGTMVPPQAEAYYSTRMQFSVYDIRLNQLYDSLLHNYMDELKEETAKGEVTSIGDHYFVRNGERVDFDNAISTIPLDSLCDFMGAHHDLQSKPVHYLHVKTNDLDFEGANQVLVADSLFSFFKVTNVAPDRYLIYSHEDIPQPGAYFMAFMPKFDIIDGTSIKNAITLGSIPNMTNIHEKGVFCVGSYAEWDWCADVGTCIIRLLGYAQRHLKPNYKFKSL
tara:strand:+ start:6946 stop:7887 length:942 start_codon:yes stop_codon:yes gene_type:complete